VTRYNFENIRILLIAGFTSEELRRLCYETPLFRPVYDQLAENTGKAKIVDFLIEYAERRMLLDTLLKEIKERNSAQFEAHQPYYEDNLEEQISSSSHQITSSSEKEKVGEAALPTPGPTFNLPGKKKSDFPKPQPVWYPNSQISAILKGYTPFPDYRAEHKSELDFLFSEAGGFWSGHPKYEEIVINGSPEVILAGTGVGKTAFANALVQIGNVDGRLLAQTLPVFITGDRAALLDVQTKCAGALLEFVRVNSSKFLALNLAEKQFLLRLWLQSLNSETVEVRLKPVLEADQSLGGLMKQIGLITRPQPKKWPEQVKLCLESLGFNQLLLVLDFNQSNCRGAKIYLEKMQTWAANAIIIKLFLPLNWPSSFREILCKVPTSELTWASEHIHQLIQWRFQCVAGLADIFLKPENFFDNNLYDQFIEHACHNPRRLAQLWRYLFEDHLNHSPNSFRFSTENMARAVPKLE